MELDGFGTLSPGSADCWTLPVRKGDPAGCHGLFETSIPRLAVYS
jgi:hypothetical protein